MTISHISAAALYKAVKIKSRIEALEQKLSDLLDGGSQKGSTTVAKPGRRRRMSAAGRARIAAAARLRWRKAKAAGRNRL
jgi:hypothetical protein